VKVRLLVPQDEERERGPAVEEPGGEDEDVDEMA
jgi:hypothetical protein